MVFHAMVSSWAIETVLTMVKLGGVNCFIDIFENCRSFLYNAWYELVKPSIEKMMDLFLIHLK